MQTEQLCWSGMTDAEHSTTSGSNEVVSEALIKSGLWVLNKQRMIIRIDQA